MRFHFNREEKADGATILRPTIPILVHGPTGSLGIHALLDSGADVSLLPNWVAETIGTSLRSETTFVGGVGGRLAGRRGCVDVNISSDEDIHTIRGVEVVAAQVRSMILGRQTVFDALRVQFDLSADEIGIEPAAVAEA